MHTIRILLSIISFAFFIGCKPGNVSTEADLNFNLVNEMNATLTEAILEDGFSPPVASRIYSYSNIAALIGTAQDQAHANALIENLNDLDISEYQKDPAQLNSSLVSLSAFCKVANGLVYRDFIIDDFYNAQLKSVFAETPAKIIQDSEKVGDAIAKDILSWARKDMFEETRNMPIYSPSGNPDSWVPTPPTYSEAIEPHWFKLRPFLLDSTSQFRVPLTVGFDTANTSEFYKEAEFVYQTVNNITDEQLMVARFWDCNPHMTKTQGHVMYKIRQITPGGHWIGITSIASEKNNLSFNDAAYIHTLVAIAVADCFLSAWDAKYLYDLIRPVSYINQYIDENWATLLETPPFPEYPSAHSVISAGASTILESYFGIDFDFVDDIEDPYGLPIRQFKSFDEAANEVNISRIYGGIHYRFGTDAGQVQGKQIGKFVIERLK